MHPSQKRQAHTRVGILLLASALVGTVGYLWTDPAEPKGHLPKADVVAEFIDSNHVNEAIPRGDHLIIGYRDQNVRPSVKVVDIKSGKQRWKAAGLPGHAWISDDTIVLQKSDTTIEVRDVATGEVRETINVHDLTDESAVPPTGWLEDATESTIYVRLKAIEKEDQGPAYTVYTLVAIDRESGEPRWKREYETDRTNRQSPWMSAPDEGPFTNAMSRYALPSLRPVSQSSVVYAVEPKSSTVVTLDEDTGEELWTQDFKPNDNSRFKQAGGNLSVILQHVNDDACTFEALVTDLESGDTKSYDVLTDFPEGRQGNCVEFGLEALDTADGHIFAQNGTSRPQVTDLTAGKPVWTADEKGTPLLHDKGVALYERGDPASTVAVDISSGQRLWTNEDVEVEAIAAGQLISTEEHGTVVRDLRTGDAMWRIEKGTLLGQGDGRYVFADDDRIIVTNTDGA